VLVGRLNNLTEEIQLAQSEFIKKFFRARARGPVRTFIRALFPRDDGGGGGEKISSSTLYSK